VQLLLKNRGDAFLRAGSRYDWSIAAKTYGLLALLAEKHRELPVGSEKTGNMPHLVN